MAAAESTSRRGWLWRHTRHIRHYPRFSVCALIFVVLAALLSAAGMRPARSLLLAFDIATLLFLAAAGYMFAHSDVRVMRRRARQQDEGRWGLLGSSVALSAVVLVALGLELHASKGGGVLEIVLAASSLLLSWLFMNTIFALHYAHEFYGEAGEKCKGLEFPGTKEPDYWDFFYFAVVIGMTFQVSDVQISNRKIRHVALVHSIVAFFFNVIIIALTVNVVAGQA